MIRNRSLGIFQVPIIFNSDKKINIYKESLQHQNLNKFFRTQQTSQDFFAKEKSHDLF